MCSDCETCGLKKHGMPLLKTQLKTDLLQEYTFVSVGNISLASLKPPI